MRLEQGFSRVSCDGGANSQWKFWKKLDENGEQKGTRNVNTMMNTIATGEQEGNMNTMMNTVASSKSL